jgi:acyl-CoA synthetase (AMP-forming)/AMP-acid ligase II
MSLIDQLLDRQNSEPLWVSENVGVVEPVEFFSRLRRVKAALANSRLVVKPKTDLDFIEMFCALDGSASDVLVLHPDMSQNDCDSLIKGFDYEKIISCIDEVITLSNASVQIPDVVTRWLLPTSGTTGTPKITFHDFRSLSRSIKNGKTNQTPRWGLMYGATRFAGLQVVLQSLLGYGTLLIPENRNDLDKTLSFFSQTGCNSLSATPTLWRKLLMSPALKDFNFQRITLGGEIADQMILNALRLSFPTVRITHIYASTEAGVGFSVTDGKAGFPLFWVESGCSPNGVGFMIDGGILKLSFPHIPAGDNTDDKPISKPEIHFIDTGDAVYIKDDRVLFLGRANGSINVGGNKVMPEEVEAVLLSHPQVHLVQVTGYKNPFTGMIVTAEVVFKPGASGTNEMDLITFCRARLESWKVPARIRFRSELDVASSGKIQRRSA